MKLVSLKILGDNFRSLASNQEYKFTKIFRKDRLSTKVLAGLNGSGKSNLLEVLAEIFYYLDIYHLKDVSKEQKLNKNVGFDIEYYLPKAGLDLNENQKPNQTLGNGDLYENYLLVKIHKPLKKLPEFTYKLSEDSTLLRLDENTEQLLPKRIIGYSSGQNELLSNPFYKIRYHYFEEHRKGNSSEINDRLFNISYGTTFSIFVANQLLANTHRLNDFNSTLGIDSLESFRITINLLDYNKKPIKLSNFQQKVLNDLKSCASSWIERHDSNGAKQHLILLDYLISDATIQAFKAKFKSAFNLFKAFYELESLNIYIDPADHRLLVRRGNKALNISEEIPKPDPDRLAFRIEKIRISKATLDKQSVTIFYKHLSDGEHQLNEVLGPLLMIEEDGCLFLLDEPDTHFNPKWRAKLIMLFNKLAEKHVQNPSKNLSIRQHEIILTTHSPYVISDSYREDVYIFKRDEKGSTIENPEPQTYGASIGFLNEHIFGRDNSIADYSNSDLEKLKENIETIEDINNGREKLFDFGESIEKFDALRYLRARENEIKSQQ